MGKWIADLYRLMDKRPLRALSLMMSLLLSAAVFWKPARFVAHSSMEIGLVLLLIWAVCTGMIHGVGFSPRRLRWQACFSPLPAFIFLFAGLLWFFCLPG